MFIIAIIWLTIALICATFAIEFAKGALLLLLGKAEIDSKGNLVRREK